MIVTEEEAKKKACCGPRNDSIGQWDRRCIGSECMAWRWISKTEKGYCGLSSDGVIFASGKDMYD
jgi:hypothetical protein